ncbi:O-Glycosyl hydrolases family 17 protein isoform 2 [Theobroma cacao]|uniref:glucan endo-1,3-beta-D-glucosidase n=1 Tax=Theobroma cacao TaxID=3641 RepID=A0A061GS44_THECC|nr:O-Glycosyl hydrolases family 17 protein isoform 2 [Theobroma cacao]
MGWVSARDRVNFWLVCLLCMLCSVSGIGVNWGTQSSHSLPPDIIVNLLKDNGFQRVKLFDADYGTLKALGKSGIEVMVGIPNDMLASVGGSMKAAEKWVAKNVSAHITSNNVNIRYVAVGNEPFLETYNGSYLNITYPALRNIQSALVKAGLGSQVKVTVPLNADVYASSSGYPSGGDFRADIHDLMLMIVNFLSVSSAPFTKNGFGNLPIIVGEIGWPTDGDRNADVEYARRFNQGFMSHISGGRGTPMRPGPIDAYLFSLIDEDDKSSAPGNFERHWGIFTFDGEAKYPLNLGTTNSGALVPAKGVKYLERKWCVMKPSARLDDPQVEPSVSYACGLADCTSLGYGTSCGNLDARGNISYAFNSYFQKNNQLEVACKFPNISMITKTDPTPTAGNCKFEIMIQPYYESAGRDLSVPRSLWTWFMFLFIFC